MALPSARRSQSARFCKGYTTAAIYAVALPRPRLQQYDGRPGHVQRAGGKKQDGCGVFPSEQLSAIPGHMRPAWR